MRRNDNLVDLEKRCKMSIWTQKSALIQLRTSLLKFDDLAGKSEKSSVSNFSTKVSAADDGRRCARGRQNRAEGCVHLAAQVSAPTLAL